MRISAIALLITFFFTLFGVACGTVGIEEPAPSGEELESVVMENADLDGNGFDDKLQSFVIAYTAEYGAVLLIRPDSQLPDGGADGQELELRGFGDGLYSDEEQGWAEGFRSLVPVYDSTGILVWYGASGLREGIYEVVCAEIQAEIGSFDGWCLPGYSMNSSDVREMIITVQDGQDGCYRQSNHWAFSVASDWVDPLGYRISPEDPNCY